VSLIESIRQKSVIEVLHEGLVYRLRPCVGGDLLQAHRALLVAVLPPNPADLLSASALESATGEDRAELLRVQARETWDRVSNPDNQRAAWEANVAAICAAVVAIREDVEGAPWESARVVAEEADRDHKASPPRLHISDLPAGAVEFIGGTARELSFGGEEARKRIRSFCERPRTADSVREGG